MGNDTVLKPPKDPKAQMVQLLDRLYAENMAKSVDAEPVLSRTKDGRKLLRKYKELAQMMGMHPAPILRIYDDPINLNFLSIASGKGERMVMIHRAFLSMPKDQMLAELGHELGHHQRGHLTVKMQLEFDELRKQGVNILQKRETSADKAYVEATHDGKTLQRALYTVHDILLQEAYHASEKNYERDIAQYHKDLQSYIHGYHAWEQPGSVLADYPVKPPKRPKQPDRLATRRLFREILQRTDLDHPALNVRINDIGRMENPNIHLPQYHSTHHQHH